MTDANELYSKSLVAYRYMNTQSPYESLDPSTYRALLRGNFGNEEGILDLEKVKEAVLDGSIWAVKCIGKIRVRKICEWIIMEENKEIP